MKYLLMVIPTLILALIVGATSVFYFHLWPKPLNVDVLVSNPNPPYAALKVYSYETDSNWMSLLGFQTSFSEAVLSYGDIHVPQTSALFINEPFTGYALDRVTDHGVVVVFDAGSTSCGFNRTYIFDVAAASWNGPLDRQCFLTAFPDLQKYVAVDPELRTLFVRSIADGSIVQQLDLPVEQADPNTSRYVVSVAVSSNNKQVALVTGPGDLGSVAVPTLSVWNIENGDFTSHLLPTLVVPSNAWLPNQLLVFDELTGDVLFQSDTELLRFSSQ